MLTHRQIHDRAREIAGDRYASLTVVQRADLAGVARQQLLAERVCTEQGCNRRATHMLTIRYDSATQTGTVTCQECGDTHPAEFSHYSQYGGHPVYAVVCTNDYLADYYTDEVVTLASTRTGDQLPFCTEHVADTVEDIDHGNPPDVSVISVVAIVGI